MISQRTRDIIALLRRWITDRGQETELQEGGDILTLRIASPLFTDGTGKVRIEICHVEHTEEMSVAQIYSTLIFQPEPGLAALRAKLPEWNFSSLAGAYGIYERLGQLYHRHNVAVNNTRPLEEQADCVFTGLCLAMNEMARRLPEALKISVNPDGTPA